MIKICWKADHPIPDEDTRERLNQMRKHKALTDMALCSEKKLFPCHKIIVTKASSYIRGLLKMEPDSSKLFVVVLGNTDQRHMESLLDFMYLGVHFVRPDDLAGLSNLAKMLYIDFIIEDPITATDSTNSKELVVANAVIDKKILNEKEQKQNSSEIMKNSLSKSRSVIKNKPNISTLPKKNPKKLKKDSPFVKNLPVPVNLVSVATTLTKKATTVEDNTNKIPIKKLAAKMKKPAVKKQKNLSKKLSAKKGVQNFTTPVNQNNMNQAHPPLAQYSITSRNQISVTKRRLTANFTQKSPSETCVELAKRLTKKALRTIRKSTSLMTSDKNCESFVIVNRGKKLKSPYVMNVPINTKISGDIQDLDPKHEVETTLKVPAITRPKRNAYQKARKRMANWIVGKGDDSFN